MWQHEAVMQFGAPANQGRGVRLLPESRDQGPQEQLLRQRHLRMRRHFKPAEFDQTEAAAGRVGRIELVDAELSAMGVAGQIDQQMAKDAIHMPWSDPLRFRAERIGKLPVIGPIFRFSDRVSGGAGGKMATEYQKWIQEHSVDNPHRPKE